MKKVRTPSMDKDKIDKMIEKYPSDPSSLIQVLLRFRERITGFRSKPSRGSAKSCRCLSAGYSILLPFTRPSVWFPRAGMRSTSVWAQPVTFVVRSVSSTGFKT